MLRTSEVLNGIGYLLTLCVLIAVGANVRQTYTAVRSKHSAVVGVQKLVIDPAKIRAGEYSFAPFRIDGRMEGAHVVGSFDTWEMGRRAIDSVVYSTERTTNAQLDVPIRQEGDYYLGFSKMFSGSDKNVFGDVELLFLTN